MSCMTSRTISFSARVVKEYPRSMKRNGTFGANSENVSVEELEGQFPQWV